MQGEIGDDVVLVYTDQREDRHAQGVPSRRWYGGLDFAATATSMPLSPPNAAVSPRRPTVRTQDRF